MILFFSCFVTAVAFFYIGWTAGYDRGCRDTQDALVVDEVVK